MDPTTRAILAAMLTGEQPERCGCGRYATTRLLISNGVATVFGSELCGAPLCDACFAKLGDLSAMPSAAGVSSHPLGNADKARLYNAFLDDCERVASQAGGGVPAMGDSAWAQLGGGRR